jgi:hypothetical protein
MTMMIMRVWSPCARDGDGESEVVVVAEEEAVPAATR